MSLRGRVLLGLAVLTLALPTAAWVYDKSSIDGGWSWLVAGPPFAAACALALFGLWLVLSPAIKGVVTEVRDLKVGQWGRLHYWLFWINFTLQRGDQTQLSFTLRLRDDTELTSALGHRDGGDWFGPNPRVFGHGETNNIRLAFFSTTPLNGLPRDGAVLAFRPTTRQWVLSPSGPRGSVNLPDLPAPPPPPVVSPELSGPRAVTLRGATYSSQ